MGDSHCLLKMFHLARKQVRVNDNKTYKNAGLNVSPSSLIAEISLDNHIENTRNLTQISTLYITFKTQDLYILPNNPYRLISASESN